MIIAHIVKFGITNFDERPNISDPNEYGVRSTFSESANDEAEFIRKHNKEEGPDSTNTKEEKESSHSCGKESAAEDHDDGNKDN